MNHIKIFENFTIGNYHIHDIIIVNDPIHNLNNRMVVIDAIHQDRDGIHLTVWNASKNEKDEQFIIDEEKVVKKMPTYKKGDYILLKDYFTGKTKPMIMSVHIELGLFEMCDLEGYIKYGEMDEEGQNREWVEEPYYNIIRKLTKKDLEKYKNVIEEYHIKKEAEKYNL
jgi:hypothetical protein